MNNFETPFFRYLLDILDIFDIDVPLKGKLFLTRVLTSILKTFFKGLAFVFDF